MQRKGIFNEEMSQTNFYAIVNSELYLFVVNAPSSHGLVQARPAPQNHRPSPIPFHFLRQVTVIWLGWP